MIIRYKRGCIELEHDISGLLVSATTEDIRIRIIAECTFALVRAFNVVNMNANDASLQELMREPEVKNTPQPINVNVSGDVGGNDIKNGSVVLPVIKLVHHNTEGKEGWKAYGGDFTKFGVPAYKDSCKDGVGFFELSYGMHDVTTPMLMTVQMKDGKPYRVTELAHQNGTVTI